jgi:hypothetical protein
MGDGGYVWIDYDGIRNYGYLYRGITVVEPCWKSTAEYRNR